MNRFGQFVVCIAAIAISCISGRAVASFLSPSSYIDVSSGFGFDSGIVSSGHQFFHFTAAEGDVFDIAVDVTKVATGSGFTDDDTELFLFDSLGTLLDENDDTFDPFESLIDKFIIPTTGTYFVAVTTFDNNPVLDSNGRGIGWEDDGQSNVEFDLLIFRSQSVPEPSSILLCIIGAIAVFGWTSRRARN